MINNDVLRRLRYALNITDLKVIELFKLAGYQMERPELESLFKKEDEAGYAECEDAVMESFLTGLVISRRGKKENTDAPKPREGTRLSNNDILKSIRIALEFKDDDIIAVMGLAGVKLSKPELTSFFRKVGQRNYRPCGDQFLRNFLVGLTTKYRV